MPKTKAKDVTQEAARMIREVTGTGVTRGEGLIGDPETRRKYIEARDKELARQRKRSGGKSKG
jgi:hypothetical protein